MPSVVNKELNILIMEDVAADVVMINHELRKGGLAFRSKRVETRDNFIRELRESPPDLIFSDHGLPAFDGFSALAIAREKCPDTPFIFVTGSMGEEMAIETFKSGATDYVLKSRLSNLVPAVQRALHLAEERTRRRQAEDALRESERRFRMLVEGVKDYAIIMLDSEGNITSWNTGAELVQGYGASEIIGRHFSCFYPAEEVQERKPDEVLNLAATKGRSEEEGWRVRKGGSPFWANVVMTALRDNRGELRGFVLVTRDVTERKHAQEALQKSEERYRRLIELCPDALLVQSNNRIVFVNSAALRLLGAEGPEQLIGKPVKEIVHPDYWEVVQRRLRQLREDGTAVFWKSAEGRIQRSKGEGTVVPFIEEKFIRLDGREVDVEVAATPLTFQDRPAVQVIARDITQRKRSTETLRETEGRRAAILETALDAVVAIDHEGKVVEWNPAAEKMFGYNRSDAVGREMAELIVPPSLRPAHRQGLAQCLATGEGRMFGRYIEMSAMRADGTVFPAELAITRIATTQPPLFTGYIRDITERKEAEAEVRRLQMELERRVRERTAQLEAANRELEAFNCSVSHDLRTPLLRIRGFAELLRQKAAPELDEENRRHLQTIAESARAMDQLIEELLAFSMLGQRQLLNTSVSVTELVKAAQNDLAQEISGRNIYWTIGELPEVHGDPAMLRQVWVNLISNALKYTRPRETARIEIGCANHRAEFVFFIRDNGIGFDVRYANKLFGIFQRLHRAEEFEGTGIGLANVQRIIQRHGGRAWAKAKVNKGAAFYFSLPKSTNGHS
jgi:PAS domain S-box-containing protein